MTLPAHGLLKRVGTSATNMSMCPRRPTYLDIVQRLSFPRSVSGNFPTAGSFAAPVFHLRSFYLARGQTCLIG